jgi:hypothetical protein
MMLDTTEEVRHWLDRLAVKDAVDRYWFFLGHLDIDSVVDTFTEDARFGSHNGKDEIRARIEHSQGRLNSLNIVPGAQHITVDGDVARADTQAVALGVVPSEQGERLLVQSLRYVDRLVRTEGGWKIAERHGLSDQTIINDILFEFEILTRSAR